MENVTIILNAANIKNLSALQINFSVNKNNRIQIQLFSLSSYRIVANSLLTNRKLQLFKRKRP